MAEFRSCALIFQSLVIFLSAREQFDRGVTSGGITPVLDDFSKLQLQALDSLVVSSVELKIYLSRCRGKYFSQIHGGFIT
jgi:hypothetical protein